MVGGDPGGMGLVLAYIFMHYPGERQGLPLVHFSAQPEPFSSLKPSNQPNVSHESAHDKSKSGRP